MRHFVAGLAPCTRGWSYNALRGCGGQRVGSVHAGMVLNRLRERIYKECWLRARGNNFSSHIFGGPPLIREMAVLRATSRCWWVLWTRRLSFAVLGTFCRVPFSRPGGPARLPKTRMSVARGAGKTAGIKDSRTGAVLPHTSSQTGRWCCPTVP
jgi:hypothetical protein